MGDLVMAARNRVQGGRGPRESKYAQLPVAPIGVVPTRYYVSLYVDDLPGVLSSVAAEFAKQEVSIAEVRQEGIVGGDGQRVGARVAVLTHPRHRCRAERNRHRTGRAGRRDEGQRCAEDGRGRANDHPRARARVWPGLIEAYRDRLPVAATWTGDALRGRHPADPRQAALRTDRLHSASEGRRAQSDGFVQDRGMTMAVTDAVERGQQAVLCASTGNTSASAAAYAARAGITCRRADSAGQDRDGQAGAGSHARRQDHSDRRKLRRLSGAGPQADRRLPDDLVGQQCQSGPDRGPEDRRVRDRRRARTRA